MEALFIEEPITYNGSQLSSLWALRTFKLQGDSIVGFRGPCQVSLEQMVDIEDVLKKSPIYSPDMLHFIIEHFDLDLEKTITRQRLLIAIIKEILEYLSKLNLNRSGDDLFFNEKKLSVSIATLTPVSSMIHAGINISTAGVPVKAAGLSEMGFREEQTSYIGNSICRAYAQETKDIKLARCKVKGVT